MKKANRVLKLFYRLLRGERVHRTSFAEEYEISERSVERDMCTIREVLSDTEDRLAADGRGHYCLQTRKQRGFTEMEVLFIAKVLLGTRTLNKEEMGQIIRGMNSLFPSAVRMEIKNAIQNEMEQYVGPQHGKKLMRLAWELNHAIQRQVKIALVYQKISGETVTRKVFPISVVPSECYLYLVGFFEEKSYPYPAFFRLDRIVSAEVTDEHYNPKLYEDYNIGRMKKCIQFMYVGKLMNVKVACQPEMVEAVRDRLPNSYIVRREGERTILAARVFGEGFLRWVMQYGDTIEVLEPEELRQKISEEAKNIARLYEGT